MLTFGNGLNPHASIPCEFMPLVEFAYLIHAVNSEFTVFSPKRKW